MALRASPSQYHLVRRSASFSRPTVTSAQRSMGESETSCQPASHAAAVAALAPPWGASEIRVAVSRVGRLSTWLRATMIIDMLLITLEHKYGLQ